MTEQLPPEEQPTEEFDSTAVIEGLHLAHLQEIQSLPDNTWKKRLRDPPELGWKPEEDETEVL